MLHETYQARLRNTMELVEAAALNDHWNQGAWGVVTRDLGSAEPLPCGTAHCFAGHAAVNAPGVTTLWSATGETADGHRYPLRSLDGGFLAPLAVLTVPLSSADTPIISIRAELQQVQETGQYGDTGARPIWTWARDYFDLDRTTASMLFDAMNTLDDLRLMVKELCDTGVIQTVPTHFEDRLGTALYGDDDEQEDDSS